MYGKIFKIEIEQNSFQSIYGSFGGLVMKINGSLENTNYNIKNDIRCYILFRALNKN